jgi:myo-inositol-1(or 4)-monophosphatase
MAAVDLQHIMTRAQAWARQAGEVALTRQGSDFSKARKSDQSLVTDVDIQIQQLITDHVAREFPRHGILAEESTETAPGMTDPGSAEYCWVIDPLDGTRNYVHGLPFYCVSIALLERGEPVVGVIHDPNCDRAYSAVKGQGAFADGRRMGVSAAGWSDGPLLGIPTPRRTPLPAAIYQDWGARGVLRHIGSTCLNLALTACGALDACFAQEVKLWDVAAGALLVTEAGGLVTSPDGQSVFPVEPQRYGGEDIAVLAGGQLLHDELMETLRP